MPATSVFGAQWGDEGKGKIIDRMAREADFVVRYQGGANAGHTVVVGGERYVLHLVPSGILHPGTVNVIANGVAVDPRVLLEELDQLAQRGVAVDPASVRVSTSAHVILDYHRRLDQLCERHCDGVKIGTTGRGIGPAYADKAARTGLRVADLIDPDRLRKGLKAALSQKNPIFTHVHDAEPMDERSLFEQYVALGRRLAPFAADAGAEVRAAWREGKRILFEGAQGIMLDIDHGTYPYVTSSNTGVHGIGAGVGFPPSHVDEVIGIAKAYCTRVGEGPFPSEDPGEEGERLRELGHEYGATTGRPRRCGWFDAVAVRYALELSGATGWILTNLDVLGDFARIPVATAYDVGGSRRLEYPADLADLGAVKPIYESAPGWMADISAVRHYEDLPQEARAYVEWLEELAGVPVVMLSVGPERDQVIPRDQRVS